VCPHATKSSNTVAWDHHLATNIRCNGGVPRHATITPRTVAWRIRASKAEIAALPMAFILYWWMRMRPGTPTRARGPPGSSTVAGQGRLYGRRAQTPTDGRRTTPMWPHCCRPNGVHRTAWPSAWCGGRSSRMPTMGFPAMAPVECRCRRRLTSSRRASLCLAVALHHQVPRREAVLSGGLEVPIVHHC
jgi:hypothetical protein